LDSHRSDSFKSASSSFNQRASESVHDSPERPSAPHAELAKHDSSSSPVAAAERPSKFKFSTSKAVLGRISSSMAHAGSAMAKPFKSLGKATKGLAQKVITPSKPAKRVNIQQIGSKRYEMGDFVGNGKFGSVTKARQVKYKNPITGRNVLTGPTVVIKQQVCVN
jgi:hypothetical protein